MSYANNKGADQPVHPCSLISTFVVRCLDSIIPLVSISKFSSLYLASMAAQASLSLTWSKDPKTGFLVMRLILFLFQDNESNFFDVRILMIFTVTPFTLKNFSFGMDRPGQTGTRGDCTFNCIHGNHWVWFFPLEIGTREDCTFNCIPGHHWVWLFPLEIANQIHCYMIDRARPNLS